MPPNFGIGMVLRGKTLGIWGYGKIGQILAGYGRAFGMQVMVWGSEASRLKAAADGHTQAQVARGGVARRLGRFRPHQSRGSVEVATLVGETQQSVAAATARVESTIG